MQPLLPPEQLLDALDGPAILITPDFRIEAANQAYLERYCKGIPPPAGRYCHEISHHSDLPCEQIGENCPVQAARITKGPARVLHIHHTPGGEEHVNVEARPLLDEAGNIRYFIETVKESRTSSPRATRDNKLIGRSPAFRIMLEMVQRVGPTETAALLLGESGTGKELVARAIHEESPRHHKPFVAVECSGLTEGLFESELFGHEKGAFTGAASRKVGLVEAAEGGTLFLDEIGDIPLTMQVKLLRLLETRTYRLVGSAAARPADFRLICATHRDLLELVERGEFRRDLYYRISAFPIHLPALRERLEDLPLIAESLLRRLSTKVAKGLSKEALAQLLGYHFPGNIRELRNLLERACLLADGDTIHTQHLPSLLSRSSPALVAGGNEEVLPLEEVERRYLLRVVSQFQGDRRALAERLGISERTLFRKLRKVRADEG